ncbi:MAG: hypothetical protein COC01_06375, partial [Bacteroidetes bacterium]
MKKIISIALLFVLNSSLIFAQVPNAFKYQAVVRDVSGSIIADQSVSVRISILQTTATGTTVYSETHAVTTNQFGLINLEIGSGTVVSGVFATIDWGSDLHFVKVELDETGGTNYLLMGTSQLLSVPYALYAENVGNSNGADSDSTNEIQVLSSSGDTLYLTNGGWVNLSGY